MRTLLWTMTIALTLSGSATAALAQEEGDEDLPEASDQAAPAAKPPLEQQRDDEGSDLGGSSEPAQEEAPAEEATDSGPAKPVSVGLLLGYGLYLGSGKNPWGLGFGIRGGYNIDQIYVGARFTYYLGSTKKETVAGAGSSETGLRLWELGIEAGYDAKVSETFTIRPELGLGAANVTNSFMTAAATLVSNYSVSKAFFYVAPGLSALLDVSESVFLGVDARIMVITSTGASTGKSTLNGLTLLANGGMRF